MFAPSRRVLLMPYEFILPFPDTVEAFQCWAGQFAYACGPSPNGLTREQWRALAANGLDMEHFHSITDWKSGRPARHRHGLAPVQIRAQTNNAFQTKDPRAALRHLVRLGGVGIPTASAILHFCHPAEFPIVDRRVAAALGHGDALHRTASPPFYTDLTAFVRGLVRPGLDLRTIDQALWAWDIAHPL